MERYGVSVNVWQCYRARIIAQKMLKSTLKQHYAKLRRYLEEQMRIYLTVCFLLQTDFDESTNKCSFKRLYISYSMLRNGFMQGCRKIIGLDGTFLEAVTGGALLATIGRLLTIGCFLMLGQ